jgi:hypothetical protein
MRPIYYQQEASWRTNKLTNARTRCAPVHPNQTASIAAHHAKAQAKLLNLIVIAAIRTAPETSDNFPDSAQFYF